MSSTYEHHLDVLKMIVKDTEEDVTKFEGAPFNGKTLGELHGNLSASVQAIANILHAHIKECHQDES
jgi:dephospho-CoA kinase